MAIPAAAFVLAPQAYLLLFAGILLAILLTGSAELVSSHSPLKYGWALLIVCLAYLAVIALLAWLILPGVISDTRQFSKEMPERVEQARKLIEDTRLGRAILDEGAQGMDLSGLQERIGQIWKRSLGILSSIMGFLGSAVIIIFIGLYLAALPGSWRWPLDRFLPPEAREKGIAAARDLYDVLWRWLIGRLLDMTMVGALTWIGLLLLGMPLPLSLGFIAGALSFIPYLGPLLSVLPAILVALPEGLRMVLWVLGLYSAVQFVESYLTTPLIQKRAVSLHPVTILVAQIILGSLFGILGVALATPLAAAAMTLADTLAPAQQQARNHEPLRVDSQQQSGR